MAQEHDLDWFLENDNEEAFASLTPDQVNTLTAGGTVAYGDTEPANADEESSESPVAADEETKKEEVQEKPEAEPVLLAKDGKHTIPFSELEAARERASQLEASNRDLTTMIESLQQAKVEDAKTGGTAAQDAVVAEYAGTYPEIFEDLKPVFEAMIEARSKAEVSALKNELDEIKAALAPMQKNAADAAVETHFATIKGAISDFDALVESGAVQDWIKTLPSYMQAPSNAVLEKGNAQEVIELFTQFKKATAQPDTGQPVPSKEEIKAAAEKVIANAKTRTPVTLTDIPAAGSTSANEEPTTAAGWQAKFSKMDPKDILAELDRR